MSFDEKFGDPDICVPYLKAEGGICASVYVLEELIKAYNKKNNEKIIIQPEIKNLELIEPLKYKLILVDKIREKTKCKTEDCWTTLDFIDMMEEKAKEEFLRFTFKPKSPQGRYTWLNTLDIDNVIKQFQKKYTDFKYFGAMPMDFADLNYYNELNKVDFDKLKNKGIKKIGFVLNLDNHNQSGSHWVGVFVNLEKYQIYYFDSVGIKPENRVTEFNKKVYNYFISKGVPASEITIDYNKIEHQTGNTECGVYSIVFILQMAKGKKTFDEYCKKITRDDSINKCRKKLFMIKKAN